MDIETSQHRDLVAVLRLVPSLLQRLISSLRNAPPVEGQSFPAQELLGGVEQPVRPLLKLFLQHEVVLPGGSAPSRPSPPVRLQFYLLLHSVEQAYQIQMVGVASEQHLADKNALPLYSEIFPAFVLRLSIRASPPEKFEEEVVAIVNAQERLLVEDVSPCLLRYFL